MPFIELGGERLFYAHHPAPAPGVPAAVLIHGAAGSHLVWPAELRRLGGAAVYALDLPAHGRSGGQERAGIAAYAEVVDAWLEALGVERVVAVGHSMGGAIALSLALSRPARLAGLVLIATGARLQVASALLEGWQGDYQATLETVNRLAWGPNVPEAAIALGGRHLTQVKPEVARGDYAACAAFDVTAKLGRIELPCLVIGAGADRLTPPQLAFELAGAIPGAQLCLVEDAGHMVMIEQSTQVGQAVARFMASVGAGAPAPAPLPAPGG